MLKYTTTQIVFSEIPDEVTLAIELSNCPFKCPACHSKHLWEDVGNELDINILDRLISNYIGISCVCFMGGDNDLNKLYDLFKFVKDYYPTIKIAWYTGRNEIPSDVPKINYIKIGPYNENYGPINKKTTNQRLYQNDKNDWIDITYKFWK